MSEKCCNRVGVQSTHWEGCHEVHPSCAAFKAGREAGMREAAKMALACIDSRQLLESLANIEHERWSGWMRYQETAPQAKRNDWPRKVAMPYAAMTNAEQESDRVEARKTLSVVRNAILSAIGEGK